MTKGPNRSRSAALAMLVALAGARAWAGPAIDQGVAERVQKLDVRPRRAPPAVVPAACPVRAGDAEGVSAAALLAELAKNNARRDQLLATEAKLDAERAELAEEGERLAVERLDLELLRAELTGGPPPPAADAPATAPAADDGQKIRDLSATVRVMKADRAAAVVALLDGTVAAQVMRALSKPAAAAIYDRLPPDKAAGIMQSIAHGAGAQVQQ